MRKERGNKGKTEGKKKQSKEERITELNIDRKE